METVTDADRDAARALRELLADMSGFWHRFDDESPLCQAFARHRLLAEGRGALAVLPLETLPVIAEQAGNRPGFALERPKRAA